MCLNTIQTFAIYIQLEIANKKNIYKLQQKHLKTKKNVLFLLYLCLINTCTIYI